MSGATGLIRLCGEAPRHQKVLFTVDSIADETAAQPRTGIKAPQDFTVVGVERSDDPERIAVEHQAASRAQDAAEAGISIS